MTGAGTDTATTSAPGGTGDGHLDGRTARAQRTRTRVVDAVLELVRAGNPRPTARQIAEKAQISLRSVYVHFDDLDDLFGAAAQRHLELLSGYLEPVDATLPIDERINAFAEQRAALFEWAGAVTDAALLWEPSSPALKEVLQRGGRVGWHDVRRLFRQCVPEGDEGERVLEAINAAASSSAWGVWRRRRGLSRDRARDVLVTTVTRLLGHSR
ncbi:MAG TPA: TetR/AcrR family transcriptional regulator [Acidimicrobiia bacterium]|jgi:AcrR family transcriptional regulator